MLDSLGNRIEFIIIFHMDRSCGSQVSGYRVIIGNNAAAGVWSSIRLDKTREKLAKVSG